MKIILALFLILLNTLEALETTDKADSVRHVVDSFGKIEEKSISEVDRLKKMFKKGKATAQVKLIYSSAPDVEEPYATAIGGILKYELASYRGFNAGVAAYLSCDIPFASGEGIKRSTELSSSKGHYAEFGELYLNYKYEEFNFRAGRQIVDTPLADTDDIRMIQNSFEAYIATYDLAGFEFMLGRLEKWAGYDAGLDEGWSKTGEDGTNFGGVVYDNELRFDAWYYNITGMTDAIYIDLGIEHRLNKTTLLHMVVQYLKESELNNSGIEATIYGFLAEVYVWDLNFYYSINKTEKYEGKESFSGFGGGALFTNMDTTIIDEITYDREAISHVVGMTYLYKNLKLLYAYGDFVGKENSNGIKAHIIEQNIGMSYSVNKEFKVGALVGLEEDKIQAQNSWNRAQVVLSYNFK